MTLQEEYELSCYRVLDRLWDDKEVYLVRHVETGKLFIKKQIDLYNQRVYERLSRLDISGVPKIYLCVEQEKKLVVIEEYIHGETLEEYLEKKEIMGEDEAVSMIIQLCRILKQLHRCRSPIIHRDLKPANIMISSDGVVKLIDFNAAKEYRMGQMEDTCLMGTREYAAPEQYGFGQSDARTDIYALGVILNRLLTGDFPKNKLYEGRLKPVIQTCIQMDADARYQSVELLERALESGKNEKQRKKNTGKRMVLHLKKRYLPVGFRTGKVWKMFAAGFGYWLITYCCLTMNFHDRSGAVQMGYALWLNRIVVWIYMIFSVFFVGNYVGLRRKFPGMKGKLWGQFLFGCGYLVLFFCVAAVVVGLLE